MRIFIKIKFRESAVPNKEGHGYMKERHLRQCVDAFLGSGGGARTLDLRIMNPTL